MKENRVLPKILASLGTLLVWFPILAPLVFGLTSLVGDGRFRFDFFIPMEIFPVTLVGGLLLLSAALLTKCRRKLISWSLGGMVGLLVISMLVSMLTGLASGETEMEGGYFVMAAFLIVLFWLSMITLGIGGNLLIRDLFRKKPAA